jgi:hypothetical protein
MHATTLKAPRMRRRWVFLGLLGALLLLVLAQAAPASAVRSPFDGGPIVTDTSTTAANDHTVYATRFSATAGLTYPLAASTTYYVKVRFSTDTVNGQPSSGNNRGFVWNGTANTWVQESDNDWTKFPSVTTTATGAIAQSQWIYYKFADTTKMGAYALIVSLSTGGTGNTLNGTSWVPVTVFDPATGGGWVHPGVTDAANAGKTAKVVDHAAPGNPLALQRIEANLCDDDNNGVVDDEQYGLVKAGSFDMAVPTGQLLQAQAGSGSTDWPDSTGFTITTADTDIALGAADQTAPTAPPAPAAAPRDAGAVISWTAASDGVGVTAYQVYRWVDAPIGQGYTAAAVKVGTVTDGTSFTDSGLTNDTMYHYFVRAVDAATNVGPRSTTVDVTPDGTPPASVAAFTATAGDEHVQLAWTNPTDPDFAGVKVVRKVGSYPADQTDGTEVYDGIGTSHDDTGLANGTHYYYAAFAYDEALNYASAADADATPALGTSLTLTATPAIVNWGKPWALSGELLTAADDPIPDVSVDLEKSTDGGLTWTLVTALTPAAGTSTYLNDVVAPQQKSQYRLVYAGDASHAAAKSLPVTVTPRVKLGRPVAPSTAKKQRAFSVYGSLAPKQAAGSKTVKVKCYLRRNGSWMLKKTVTATNADYGAASRYRVRFSLPSSGSWRLVATSAKTAKYAATTSGTEYMKVK